MSWKIIFFQTQSENFPVKEFIEEQELSTSTKITHYIDLLESYGPFLKPPYIKKIQDNLYEIRIAGKTAIRIFYTAFNNQFYLVHAFKKKKQKTPQKEIKTALDRIKKLI